MDISKLLKGQKVDFNCPNCDRKIIIDASNIFKKGKTIKCTSCGCNIEIENNKSIRDIKKNLEKLF